MWVSISNMNTNPNSEGWVTVHVYVKVCRYVSRYCRTTSLVTNTHADTFRNNPWIMNLIVRKETKRQRERDNSDTDTKIFRAHEYPSIHALTFSNNHTKSHIQTHKKNVCVCVFARDRVCLYYCKRASSRRARQFMGRVPWPDIRVQIRKTSKQVVVLRCGLTSECLNVGEDLL